MPDNLERIRISGFKSIRSLDLEIHAMNILIGANGSGKSNFIEVFRLLNSILEERLQTYSGSVGAESLLHYGSRTSREIYIELFFGHNGYEVHLIPSDIDTLIFAEEAPWFHDIDNHPRPFGEVLGSGHKETLLHRTDSRIATSVRTTLSSWKIYHFHDTSRDSLMKKLQNIHDNLRLHPDASNIAAFLFLLREKHKDNYRRIVHMVRQVAPFFDDFVLHPSPLNEEKILLQWREVNRENLFNAHALSDGTIRFICLATLLLQPQLPSIILIDEPELGLHPFAINILAGLLKSAATKTQVIVATQSVPLINQFDMLDDIIVVDRKEGQSTFNRLDNSLLRDWMSEYGIGDLWEKNVIGGRPQRESA
jgi:predicted ATPase